MKKIILLFVSAIIFYGCSKDNYPLNKVDENIDYFSKREVKPSSQWNALDSLCDTIRREYGVEIIYEYTPRIIAGTTFFVPPQYEKALPYTKIVLERMWLKPLKENFPKFFNGETPIEFILAGGFIHFNSPTTTSTAAGAGLNAQFYRLGMGGINNFSTNKTWLYNHLITLYHEHAHQIDHKYGRGYLFDRVSQGKYYGLAGYVGISELQAQKDGFWKGYGGYAPEEDFATNVEYMVRYNEAWIKNAILVSESQDLDMKYKMVHQMYLDLGIDLHQLQIVVDSVANKVNY